MAGPKAPSGSLRGHGSTASQSRSKGGADLFASRKIKDHSRDVVIGDKSFKSNEFVSGGDDDDDDDTSSSSSSSDSDSDADSEDEAESAIDLRKRLAKQSSSKSNGVPSPEKKVSLDKKASPEKIISKKEPSPEKKETLAKTITINGLSASSTKPASVDKKVAKKESVSDASTSSDEDSDSESDSSEEEETTVGAKLKKEAESKSDTESESDSSEDESEKKAGKAKTVAEVPAKEETKADSDSETSSEEESDAEESSSESGESDSEGDTKAQIESQLKNDAQRVKAANPDESSSSEEDEDPKKKTKATKSFPSPSISSNEDGDVEMADETTLTKGGHPTAVGTVPEFVAPNFHLRKLVGGVADSDVASFFAKAQKEGKQVWYITAPATLPVTVVQDAIIPMDQAQQGQPVLSHDGEDYGMNFEDPSISSSFKLLIPNKRGNEYSMVGLPVEQTMHFTRTKTFPAEGPSLVTTTKTITTTRPARPQPEGLKTRYTPLGVPTVAKPFLALPSSKQSAAAAKLDSQPIASTGSQKKRKLEGSTPKDSAKKQKTQPQPPVKQTPIPLPPMIGGPRSKSVSASQSFSHQAPTSSLALPPSSSPSGAAVTGSQPLKRTPIPAPMIPTNLGAALPSVDSFYAPEKVKERENRIKARERAEKEGQKAVKAAALAARNPSPPKRVSVVPVPRRDSRGRSTS